MSKWHFIKTPKFWITMIVTPLLIGLILLLFSSKPKIPENNSNRGGDIIIKAGDGGIHGNGGNINIRPGVYKAGDAIQKSRF